MPTLDEWRAGLIADKDGVRGSGDFWYDPEPPFRDFNRELCPPGRNEALPDGAVGVRADDDFWTVALLPWEFRDTPFEEIVATLWGHLDPPAICRPDHEDDDEGADNADA